MPFSQLRARCDARAGHGSRSLIGRTQQHVVHLHVGGLLEDPQDRPRHVDVFEHLDGRRGVACARGSAREHLCELRLDYSSDPDVAKLLAAKPLPVLATVRPKWEGGRFEGDEPMRLGRCTTTGALTRSQRFWKLPRR